MISALRAQYGVSIADDDGSEESPADPRTAVSLVPDSTGEFSASVEQLIEFMGERGTFVDWKLNNHTGEKTPGRAVVQLHDLSLSFDGQPFVAKPEYTPAKRPFRQDSKWTLAELQGMSPGGTD